MSGFIYILIECEEYKAESYVEYLQKQAPLSRQDNSTDEVWICDLGVFDFILMPIVTPEPALEIIKKFSEKYCPENIWLHFGDTGGKMLDIYILEKGIIETIKMRMSTFLRDYLPKEYAFHFQKRNEK